jgi:hypothetical protein
MAIDVRLLLEMLPNEMVKGVLKAVSAPVAVLGVTNSVCFSFICLSCQISSMSVTQISSMHS